MEKVFLRIGVLYFLTVLDHLQWDAKKACYTKNIAFFFSIAGLMCNAYITCQNGSVIFVPNLTLPFHRPNKAGISLSIMQSRSVLKFASFF